MKFQVVIIAGLGVALICAYNTDSDPDSDSECPQVCPKIIDPICAFDGVNSFRYFHNECLMRYNKCRSGTSWSETQMSLCLHELDPIVLKECLHPCPFNYLPICATDGKTNEVFGNSCILDVENCISNEKWKTTQHSECDI